MLLLGLDTATAVTTVALVRSGSGAPDEVLGERSHVEPRRHGEVLPVQINEVLHTARVAPADLDAIAVGIGPGAFTGLRVGLATAQALGQALQIPVHGVSTLDVLAYDTGRHDGFAVATDARRREFFWATYTGHDSRSTAPAVGSASVARNALLGLTVICPPGTPVIDGLDPVAGDQPSGSALCQLVLARLAGGEVLDRPVPLYLRRPDGTPSSGPKSVLS
ncbi:MAG: tRNA (adenosine(37)-N6)-threonylcarbamoyltransferase complex dimerization subunit type 1 TsaB [Actinomycetia bacterium]|nr:tRNA (adenosine(37)-N6)-threonylcarbamoyltransferase complex dimerization subunit type 1 TsaB [Actinomycetes bacterium]